MKGPNCKSIATEEGIVDYSSQGCLCVGFLDEALFVGLGALFDAGTGEDVEALCVELAFGR